MDPRELTASKLNSENIAQIVEQLQDLRQSVWLEAGYSTDTHRMAMRWLDDLELTGRRRRARILRYPLPETLKVIRANTYYQVDRSEPVQTHSEFVLIEPGPHEIFQRGAHFSTTEMREMVAASKQEPSIFSNGTRFRWTNDGRTCYWYASDLWEDGEEPRPWFRAEGKTGRQSKS